MLRTRRESFVVCAFRIALASEYKAITLGGEESWETLERALVWMSVSNWAMRIFVDAMVVFKAARASGLEPAIESEIRGFILCA